MIHKLSLWRFLKNWNVANQNQKRKNKESVVNEKTLYLIEDIWKRKIEKPEKLDKGCSIKIDH